VRELLGLRTGTKVDFRLSADGNFIVAPIFGQARREKFSKLRGHAGKGMTTDEIMALTRGET
jgi:antitoxin PrlF